MCRKHYFCPHFKTVTDLPMVFIQDRRNQFYKTCGISVCYPGAMTIFDSSVLLVKVGEGEKLVRALFAVARELQPSIIFIGMCI